MLVPIADDDAHLQAIFELDAATNDRLLAERSQRRPASASRSSSSAVPHAAVVNASFCHPHPLGSRFNGPDRGAWYAAFELATSQAEVGFHKSVQLAEIGMSDDTVTFDDYLADFSASFTTCAAPTASSLPVADELRGVAGARGRPAGDGALGVVYPSVRHEGGTCLACFRPALVGRVRRAKRWRFTWRNGNGPVITRDR